MIIKFYCLVSVHVASFVGMLRTRVDRYRVPHPDLVLWVSSGSGVRYFVVRVLCGRGIRHSVCQNDTELAVASMLKQVYHDRLVEHCVLAPFGIMEEVLYGSVWRMISPLTTDNVVKLRTTACRWSVGDKYGLLSEAFFSLFKMEQFEKYWYCDHHGKLEHTLLRLRNPITDGVAGCLWRGTGNILCQPLIVHQSFSHARVELQGNLELSQVCLQFYPSG